MTDRFGYWAVRSGLRPSPLEPPAFPLPDPSSVWPQFSPPSLPGCLAPSPPPLARGEVGGGCGAWPGARVGSGGGVWVITAGAREMCGCGAISGVREVLEWSPTVRCPDVRGASAGPAATRSVEAARSEDVLDLTYSVSDLRRAVS